MSQVSIEVAEQVLSDHVARNGDDLSPYHVLVSRGTLPPRAPAFIDMQRVREEQRLRRGHLVVAHPAFRLQQWLAAEAMIRARWPAHQAYAIPCDLLVGLDHAGFPPACASSRRPACGP